MKKPILVYGITLVVASVVAVFWCGGLSFPTLSEESVGEANLNPEVSMDSGDIVDVSTMSACDIQLAKHQVYCPVTLLRFLNMNVGGIRVHVQGRDVLVANSWAKEELLESPNEYLKILDRWEEAQAFNQSIDDAFSSLSKDDQILAKEQKLCLVDNTVLGAKGPPVKVEIQSSRINLRKLIEPRTETIFACCDKCKIKVLEMPEKHFDLLDRNRFLADARRNLSPIQIAGIEESFSGLSRKDRAIAEKQLICPVTEIRLGTAGFGAPIRVDVDGTAVMICCEGCRKNLLNFPKKYFDELRRYHMVAAGLSMPISNLATQTHELVCRELPIVPLPKFDLPQMELPK